VYILILDGFMNRVTGQKGLGHIARSATPVGNVLRSLKRLLCGQLRRSGRTSLPTCRLSPLPCHPVSN